MTAAAAGAEQIILMFIYHHRRRSGVFNRRHQRVSLPARSSAASPLTPPQLDTLSVLVHLSQVIKNVDETEGVRLTGDQRDPPPGTTTRPCHLVAILLTT